MEGNAAGNKRRRVYSVEAKKVAQSAFTRNYVNYLIPALTKIKNQNSTTTSSDFKNVKYEVDMAMAFSAQGFAWSHGLKLKLLQRDEDEAPTTTEKASSNPSLKTSSDEDEKMKSQLSSLRKLIPGGEEIVDEEMVTELESYISCLEMQVNVLQCLLSLS
ncbi:hypothetical protein HN51_064304 [Arachis hypogaea]|uniref:transcription factor bHLH146 n=1 Tax=Arachis ipaensis TaxID=130454 RepID=UPI0007AFC2F3|nr:transcription factor bHLH146 [Arachis ipaensis]XP_025630779.1 transcription factor bHLH146 [Arachis hypogaea]